MGGGGGEVKMAKHASELLWEAATELALVTMDDGENKASLSDGKRLLNEGLKELDAERWLVPEQWEKKNRERLRSDAYVWTRRRDSKDGKWSMVTMTYDIYLAIQVGNIDAVIPNGPYPPPICWDKPVEAWT
jgi:hypothetical protein